MIPISIGPEDPANGEDRGCSADPSLSRDCPVCGASTSASSLYLAERLDSKRMSGFSYASRKEPEFMNHRLVRCADCELVYVDRPPTQAELGVAYHVAEYDSAEEAEDAAAAYVAAIAPILGASRGWTSALEIGTGTGVFLERLTQLGFGTVLGLEPSAAAIAAAPVSRQQWIRNSIFVEDELPHQSFDLICCFMTMEHVRDPGALTLAVKRLLRPGGAFVTVTHDYRSPINRVLGRRSPIIDIEHMQLFSKKSLRILFERAGFEQISMRSFANRYSIRYWLRLAPLPRAVKHAVDRLLSRLHVDRIKLSVNVGNVFTAGIKGP